MKGRRLLYLLTAYVIVNLGATALPPLHCNNSPSPVQLESRLRTASFLFLNGAPSQVNQMRLFLMGTLLVMTWLNNQYRAAPNIAQRRLAARTDRPLAAS